MPSKAKRPKRAIAPFYKRRPESFQSKYFRLGHKTILMSEFELGQVKKHIARLDEEAKKAIDVKYILDYLTNLRLFEAGN